MLTVLGLATAESATWSEESMIERAAAYAPTPPLWLSDVDVQIIRTIAYCKYMSAKDITYFHYEPTSLTYVRRRASRLAGGADHVPNQYLYRFNQSHTGPGHTEKIFAMGAKGWDMLASVHGIDAVDARTKPYKLQVLTYPFLRHALLLSRFVTAATYWSRQQADYTLVETILSYALAKNRALTAITVQGNPVSVIADAFLCFERVQDGARFPILFEADCGTESVGRHLRQHIRNRLAYIQSPQYKVLAGTSAGRICYLTIGQIPRYKESRMAAMQRLTQDILTELNMQHFAPVFLFAACDYRQLYQTPLCDQPVWYHPHSQTPVTLFDPIPPQEQSAASADKEHTDGEHTNLA